MTERDGIKFTITRQTTNQIKATMPVQSGIMDSYGAVHAKAVLWFAEATAASLSPGGFKGETQLNSLCAGLAGDKSIKSFYASSQYESRRGFEHIIRTKITDQTGRLIADVTTNYKLSETVFSNHCN